MEIGYKIIDVIGESKLFRVERVGEANLIVWSANASSQLTELVHEYTELKKDKPCDT